jgi:hypothetical protein
VDELHPDAISIAAGVPALRRRCSYEGKSLIEKEKFFFHLFFRGT